MNSLLAMSKPLPSRSPFQFAARVWMGGKSKRKREREAERQREQVRKVNQAGEKREAKQETASDEGEDR